MIKIKQLLVEKLFRHLGVFIILNGANAQIYHFQLFRNSKAQTSSNDPEHFPSELALSSFHSGGSHELYSANRSSTFASKNCLYIRKKY